MGQFSQRMSDDFFFQNTFTVGFFILSQPERKILNSKIETKHYKDFLWIMTIKTPLKTNDFVNFSLKSSPE
jgi:hypothetical protein